MYAINYTYWCPGDFTILVNVSNMLGYSSFTKAVRVMSTVNDLVPGIAESSNSYVSYLKTTSTGLAEYVFSYYGDTKAGSHATVMFWPGDAQNATLGPFPLSIDFLTNISKTQLQYSYTQMGTYQAVFLVKNPLGSKVFTFMVNVVNGMSGFYISVNPLYCLPNQPVTVSAYLIQGSS